MAIISQIGRRDPRVRALIAGHRTRPITARVTLTTGVTDVVKIYRHWKDELGFHEIGFAPVTTSPDRLYAINERGMDGVRSNWKSEPKGLGLETIQRR
jgi:uncharacterized protein